jgi:serine/threonine protein kinase
MSNNTRISFSNERHFNGTETKSLNLSEIKGKNAISPDETGTKDVFINWLELNKHVHYFEFSDFKNLKSIGKGSYGSVFRANWKNSDQVFALKSFSNDESTLHQIINEVDNVAYVIHSNNMKINLRSLPLYIS